MRVVQVSDSLAVEYGGTAASCAQLANHLAGIGVDTAVLTLEDHRGVPRWPLAPTVSELACHPAAPHPLAFCPDIRRVLSAAHPDLVHIHGLWRLHYAQAARWAFRAGRPAVVSVHGMLHPLARAEQSGSKQIARRLFQDTVLRRARCLHVTAAAEADEVRRLGFTGPFAVIPWGVDVPDAEDTPPATGSDGTRRVLYLGRLRPSKGLDVLLRAWAQVSVRVPDWRLAIAGIDVDGYQASLQALASELGVQNSVDWVGPVDGGARERAFAQAELVVLPSSYENFGLVVAESLARGVRVVATEGAPWSALVEEACGWWIPTGVDALAATLADALGRPAAERRAMGERGRRYARATFRWETTAQAMRHLYAWLLGGEPVPPFVSA